MTQSQKNDVLLDVPSDEDPWDQNGKSSNPLSPIP